MFIVYDDCNEIYLTCFNTKKTAETFKKEYAKRRSYDEDDILVIEVPYNAKIEDILSPTTYYVTIHNSAEAIFAIEANSEEEAENEAYKLFNDGDGFTYATEIIETYKEEE